MTSEKLEKISTTKGTTIEQLSFAAQKKLGNIGSSVAQLKHPFVHMRADRFAMEISTKNKSTKGKPLVSS